MADFIFEGKTYHTYGDLPRIDDKAPGFTLTKIDLSELRLEDLHGKNVILNIFPSLDTDTCAGSVRAFNQLASKLDNFIIYSISADLPFAQKRFCTSEEVNKINCASVFRYPEFGENYGVVIIDGPFEGLLARAIVAINAEGNVIYTQFVKEIIDEPDYDELVNALSSKSLT